MEVTNKIAERSAGAYNKKDPRDLFARITGKLLLWMPAGFLIKQYNSIDVCLMKDPF